MLGAASYYLREVLGQEHAVRVVGELVPPLLGLLPAPVPEAAAEAPRLVLH